MNTQIATTTHQSHRLIACGVDPNSADMSVRIFKEPYGDDMAWHTPKLLTLPYDEARTIYGDEEITPAWSLSALLALLPDGDGQVIKFIYNPFGEDRSLIELSNPIELSGDVKLYRNDSGYWIVDYDWDGFQGTLPQDKDPIEAVVQAIELLHANNVSLNSPIQ